MSIEDLKGKLPDFAKDVRLNLGSMAGDESFTPQQKYGLFVACALATRNDAVVKALVAEARPHLSPEALEAAKSAASIMAMNNVYYRFLHLSSNPVYGTLPARLRMNVIANPGVPKVDFELWCLAVSAMNGCGTCVDSHEKVLVGAGVDTSLIQTSVRFAAIIQSAAVALEAADLAPAA